MKTASNYNYTVSWFSQNIPIWDAVVLRDKPGRILEIGSYEGESTCYLIENCKSLTEIHCIDTWAGGIEHDSDKMAEVEQRFHDNVSIALKSRKKRPKLRLVIHKSLSVRALAKLLTEDTPPFDMIYIDGSHEAPDVLCDSILAFHLIKVGGLMVFYDYLWSMEPLGWQDPINMPKPAIDAFINTFQRKIQVIANIPLNKLFIRKTED